MKHLFTPWRFEYITSRQSRSCVFCAAHRQEDDEKGLVLFRGKEVFVLLNRYPYTNGHLMIAPLAHEAALGRLADPILEEMVRVLKVSETILARAYQPAGFNVGMNLGGIAGAGVPDHLHLHLVPRWAGDTSYMTVVGETRVLPEELHSTFARLRPLFSPPGHR